MARRETDEERAEKKRKARLFQLKNSGMSGGNAGFVLAEAQRGGQEADQRPGAHGRGENRNSRIERHRVVQSRDPVDCRGEDSGPVENITRINYSGLPVVLDANVILHGGPGRDGIRPCQEVMGLLFRGVLALCLTGPIENEITGCMDASEHSKNRLHPLHLYVEPRYKRQVLALFESAYKNPGTHVVVPRLKADPSDTKYLRARKEFQLVNLWPTDDPRGLGLVRLITRDTQHLLPLEDATVPLVQKKILHPTELLQAVVLFGLTGPA